MRSSTLKWLIFLASVVLASIVFFQITWLRKIYNYEEQVFTTNVVKTIRGLFEDLNLSGESVVRLQSVLEQPSPGTFLIRINSIPVRDSLGFYLSHELEDFDILTDCKLGVYDASRSDFAYQLYIPYAGAQTESASPADLVLNPRPFNYLMLFFPHRSNYILHEMRYWLAGTLLILLILIGLAASVFYLYQQKFLNEVQRDFVNNFTHEFKTPLSVIKIASDVLAQSGIKEHPDRLKKYAGIIQQQTQHLQTQVDKLLRTARGDNKELELEKQRVVPNELVYESLQQLEPLIEEKNASIETRLEEENTPIQADRVHLQLVMVNLLENALKYAKNPHVVVVTHRENGSYSLSVRDNGVGIEKKYIHKLFRKFFRVPTGNIHDVKGFGLGLNFVKKVVDAHQGKVVVNSVPGIGSEFKIILPVQSS